jgi:hypothetical protein
MRFDIFHTKPDRTTALAARALAMIGGLLAFFDWLAKAGAAIRCLPAKIWLAVGLAFIGAAFFAAHDSERPAPGANAAKPEAVGSPAMPAHRGAIIKAP